MPSTTSNLKQLKQAIQLAEQISELQSQLDEILNSLGTGQSSSTSEDELTVSEKRGRKKGGMSAAGRERVAAAQRRRWAKINEAKSALAAVSSPTKRKSKKKR